MSEPQESHGLCPRGSWTLTVVLLGIKQFLNGCWFLLYCHTLHILQIYQLNVVSGSTYMYQNIAVFSSCLTLNSYHQNME